MILSAKKFWSRFTWLVLQGFSYDPNMPGGLPPGYPPPSRGMPPPHGGYSTHRRDYHLMSRSGRERERERDRGRERDRERVRDHDRRDKDRDRDRGKDRDRRSVSTQSACSSSFVWMHNTWWVRHLGLIKIILLHHLFSDHRHPRQVFINSVPSLIWFWIDREEVRGMRITGEVLVAVEAGFPRDRPCTTTGDEPHPKRGC